MAERAAAAGESSGLAETTQESGLDVAVIGLAGRFPGARSIDDFWDNLQVGRETITFFSDTDVLDDGIDPQIQGDPLYVKAAPLLEDYDRFDARLFAYSPREARTMDPQHRVLLECGWTALEHAGYDPMKIDAPIGVFVGAAMNTYLLFSGLLPEFSREYLLTLISNDKDFLATRLSYKLNLRGPSVTVQTACSTSLVALHLACQSLLNDECDLALAGAVSVRVPHRAGYLHRPGSVFSPDGHCRAFDAAASGTIFGSGVGVVVLKRLSEALRAGDCIHAVVKGTAINNDGSAKVEFTAPSVHSQSEAMVEALAHAGVDAATLSYVEAHGTGTRLGDPIEVAALARAFRLFTDATGYCAIGSVKPNVGHLDVAAGMAGLIKTILALEHRQIPPSLHFREPNPELDLIHSPFYVNTTLADWTAPDGPRRAAVNSLGMGGTNAFAVLEEAPPVACSTADTSRSAHLLVMSARTSASLEAISDNLADYFEQHPDTSMPDVAYTLSLGRRELEHRRSVVCTTPADAAAALRALDGRVSTGVRPSTSRDIVFMFAGQGAQCVDMGRELYRTEPVFRRALHTCAEQFRAHLGLDLLSLLYPAPEAAARAATQLDQTEFTQPALFAVEYALAELWRSWGVGPWALIGHSLGEYSAACLAGVFSLESAIELVATRGQLMQALPRGSMLAVPLPDEALQPYLDGGVWVAATNAPSLTVVSGECDAVEHLRQRLERERGLSCRPVRTSHAFHSGLMDPMLAAFRACVERAAPRPPQVPFVSNVTGTWITPDQATDPDYWTRHVRQPVRFADGLATLLETPERILLELGPGQTLCSLARLHPRARQAVVVPSLPPRRPEQSEAELLLAGLGGLWLAGGPVDWAGFFAHEARRRLPLPTYPFERQRYWFEPTSPAPVVAARDAQPTAGSDQPTLASVQEIIAAIWCRQLGLREVDPHANFFNLGGTSLMMFDVIVAIDQALSVDLSPLNLLESPTVAGLTECVARMSGHVPSVP